MCGRYTLVTEPEAIARLFRTTGIIPNDPPRYNIAPTQDVMAVRHGAGGNELVSFRWGLVPSWSKSLPTSKPLINARSETVAEKPSFRRAFRHRRALMPADGFYEWRRPDDGAKQPFNIHRVDGQPFAMAAIWESWTSPDGEVIESCAVLTTGANKVLEPIHHRMPVILAPEQWSTWLTTPEAEAESLVPLLVAAPDDLLVADPISDNVNRVANDGPDLVRPLGKNETPGGQGTLF